MTNFHDLKLKDDSAATLENAVAALAVWLIRYSKPFDYDTASMADARTVALGILTEAKELCEDEGCPRAGTVHVCIPKGEPVPYKDEFDNPILSEASPLFTQMFGRGRRPCRGCGRVPFGDEPCTTIGCLEVAIKRTADFMGKVIAEEIQKKEPEGVKLIDGSYERGDGSIAWNSPEGQDRRARELMGVPIRCVLCKQAPCQCPPYAPWVADEPGEHSEVIAAIEAHNTGEEE